MVDPRQGTGRTRCHEELFAALAVVALVGVAGCGGSDDEASRCEPVPAWFLRDLEYGFGEEGRTWATAPPYSRPTHSGVHASSERTRGS